MQRALDLAAKGVGQVSPGPLVGTVIVDARGEVVGEGFYLYDEVKHAETVALEQAADKARGGTAYASFKATGTRLVPLAARASASPRTPPGTGGRA